MEVRGGLWELELAGGKLMWFFGRVWCFSCIPQRPRAHSPPFAHLHRSWKMAKWDCWGNLFLKHCYCSRHCHLLLRLCFMMWDLRCLPTEEGKWAFSRNKGQHHWKHPMLTDCCRGVYNVLSWNNTAELDGYKQRASQNHVVMLPSSQPALKGEYLKSEAGLSVALTGCLLNDWISSWPRTL